MKNLSFTFLVICLFLTINVGAQDTIRYDENWNVTTSTIYSFYSVKKFNSDGSFLVKDYFRNGMKQMEGNYSNENTKTGKFTYYYKNGKIESQGEYKNNNRINKWIENNEDGSLRLESYYENGLAQHEWKYYYNSGELMRRTNFINGKAEGSSKGYFKNGLIKEDLNFVNDTMKGNQFTFYENGKKKRVEIYEKGKRIKAECYDMNEKKIPFFEYFIHPVFKDGGEPGLFDFLKSKIKYPKAAILKNIEGKVIVKFEILKDGTPSNVSVIKSVDPLLDNEALRIVKLTKWIPGTRDGELDIFEFTLPVEFVLED